jgi:hypothetical protein
MNPAVGCQIFVASWRRSGEPTQSDFAFSRPTKQHFTSTHSFSK